MGLASRNIEVLEYDFVLSRTGGGRVPCVASDGGRVIRFDPTQSQPVPHGASLLDTFLDEFEALPDIAEQLPRARQEFAKDLLAQGGPADLRSLRLQRGMSQRDMADAIGTSQAAVSEYEAGKREPTSGTLRKMASALGVDFNTLMGALANG